MTEREIIKGILRMKGMTQRELAELAGLKGQNNVAGMLNNSKSGMRVANLVLLLDALNCELIIRDTASEKEWGVTRETLF